MFFATCAPPLISPPRGDKGGDMYYYHKHTFPKEYFYFVLISFLPLGGTPTVARFGMVLDHHPGQCNDQSPDLRCLVRHCPCAYGVEPEFTTIWYIMKQRTRTVRGVVLAADQIRVVLKPRADDRSRPLAALSYSPPVVIWRCSGIKTRLVDF